MNTTRDAASAGSVDLAIGAMQRHSGDVAVHSAALTWLANLTAIIMKVASLDWVVGYTLTLKVAKCEQVQHYSNTSSVFECTIKYVIHSTHTAITRLNSVNRS
eukprot:COSAG02_NODE_516_length_20804_cov_162.717460_7_plen_103_part_00